MKKIIFSLAVISLLVAPVMLYAAPGDTPATPLRDIQGVKTLADKLVAWVQWILFAVAAVFFVLAAFTYLTAGGDAEKTGKAKKQITGAVIALIIALLATGITAIINNFFGTQVGS